MEIFFKTTMSELPETCMECRCDWCRLPCKGNVYEQMIKSKYQKQRHEKCPLVAKQDDAELLKD